MSANILPDSKPVFWFLWTNWGVSLVNQLTNPAHHEDKARNKSIRAQVKVDALQVDTGMDPAMDPSIALQQWASILWGTSYVLSPSQLPNIYPFIALVISLYFYDKTH